MNSFDYVFYDVSLDYIEIFSKDLANTFTTLGNGWSRFSADDVFNLIMSAIKVYYFKTHSLILMSQGRKVPLPEELKVLTEQLKVPRFVRDIARELCRPMIFNNNIYLPNFEFEGAKGEFGCDIFYPIKDILMKWDYTISKIQCEVVKIEAESPVPVPLSFYDPFSQDIWMAKQLPEWRIEAVLYLRHLRYKYIDGIEVILCNLDATSDREKSDGKSRKKKDRDETSEYIEPQLWNMRRSGRKVGGFSGFSVSTLSHRRELGFIPPQYRFATLEEGSHSDTPPPSRRVSDLPNHGNRGQKAKERSLQVPDAVEKLSKMTKKEKANISKKTTH